MLAVWMLEDDALYIDAARAYLVRAAERAGHSLKLRAFSTGAELRAALAQSRPLVCLIDVRLAAQQSGLAALGALSRAAHQTPFVVHSVLADHATIVQAMRSGAYDYLPKQAGLAALWRLLAALVASQRARPSSALAQSFGMVGQSAAIRALIDDIEVARRSQGSALIVGPAGSGKELVARALDRGEGPFISVDAATLDESLATSLLFGATRGAFTGAERDRAGLIEQADGGTLYIDEIANLGPQVQAKLLRVLEAREVVRLGSHRPRPVRFRLLAATNVDLARAASLGAFRYDLLTRLQVFVLRVPALSQRLDDIVPLFAHLLARHSQGPVPPCHDDLVAALLSRPWHGNVRELSNAAMVALARCPSGPISAQHLPPPLPAAEELAAASRFAAANADLEVGGVSVPGQGRSLSALLAAHERTYLEQAYAAFGGNISGMAGALGVDRSRLHGKLVAFGLHRPRRRH